MDGHYVCEFVKCSTVKHTIQRRSSVKTCKHAEVSTMHSHAFVHPFISRSYYKAVYCNYELRRYQPATFKANFDISTRNCVVTKARL